MTEYEIQREAALLTVEAFKKLDEAREKNERGEYAGGFKAYKSVIGRVRQKLARDIMDIWFRKCREEHERAN